MIKRLAIPMAAATAVVVSKCWYRSQRPLGMLPRRLMILATFVIMANHYVKLLGQYTQSYSRQHPFNGRGREEIGQTAHFQKPKNDHQHPGEHNGCQGKQIPLVHIAFAQGRNGSEAIRLPNRFPGPVIVHVGSP